MTDTQQRAAIVAALLCVLYVAAYIVPVIIVGIIELMLGSY